MAIYTYTVFIFSDTERIQPATSSLSISGAEDGSSPESPAPSLPPKPAFSYSNVSLKIKESPHRQSTEILGKRQKYIFHIHLKDKIFCVIQEHIKTKYT